MKSTPHTTKCLAKLHTALAIAVAGYTGPALAQTTQVTVQHAKGSTTVATQPAKTVVFDLPSLDIMQVLGVRAAGVPKSSYPASLSVYNGDAIPKTGTLFEPDQDAIGKIAPDLIIVGGRSRAKFDDVAKLAPTLDLSIDPGNALTSIERNTNTLAAIFKKEAEAKAALEKLKKAVTNLKTKS